jgi:sterol desaturase/sphingolipid hydroxylase (fatty acid hydroxylase superfamily)
VHLIGFAIPFFLVTMALEAWALTRPSRGSRRGYEPRDTAASLTMGVINFVLLLATKGVHLAFFTALYQHRLFTIPITAWSVPLLIVCEDFCYYWFHRCHHEVRFLWAAHVNHHSSTRYNLSTALRQSWATPFTGPIFWAPLPLLGFDPLAIAVAQSFSLLYQYWLHTELIGSMGLFERVFNTPSHHRVHHGKNARYLDRNHGGILIVWDRLFGTFEPEIEPVRYGLTADIHTFHPLRVATHEWVAMIRDARAAKSARGFFGALFAPPGYREDGTGKTSAVLRAEALAEARAES